MDYRNYDSVKLKCMLKIKREEMSFPHVPDLSSGQVLAGIHFEKIDTTNLLYNN